MEPLRYEVRTPTVVEVVRAWDLRFLELRAPWGQPRGSERDEIDHFPQKHPHAQPQTFVAVRDDGVLIGTGRVHRTGDSHDEAQLRFLAVAPDARGRGVGTALVRARVKLARTWGVSLVWCNARASSRGIYERLGFAAAGPGPTLYSSIEQTRMELRLR